MVSKAITRRYEMPVNTTFGMIGNYLYIIAVLGVAGGMMAGPVLSAYDSSRDASSGTIALGVQQQVDSLKPGMVAPLSLDTMPGDSASVTLSGDNVTATVDGGSTSLRVDATFAATYTIAAGYDYRVMMTPSGEVEVTN
jgi:hypothetical protein